MGNTARRGEAQQRARAGLRASLGRIIVGLQEGAPQRQAPEEAKAKPIGWQLSLGLLLAALLPIAATFMYLVLTSITL